MFCFVICKGQCHFSYALMWKRWRKGLYVPHIWSLNVVSDLSTAVCCWDILVGPLFSNLYLSFSHFLSLCSIVLWNHTGTAGLIHRERSWSKVNEKSTPLSLSLPVFSALQSFIHPVSLCCINLVFIFYLVLIPCSFFFFFTSLLAFKFNVSDVLWSLPCAWYP